MPVISCRFPMYGDAEVSFAVEVCDPAAAELAAEDHGVVALGLGDGLVEVRSGEFKGNPFRTLGRAAGGRSPSPILRRGHLQVPGRQGRRDPQPPRRPRAHAATRGADLRRCHTGLSAPTRQGEEADDRRGHWHAQGSAGSERLYERRADAAPFRRGIVADPGRARHAPCAASDNRLMSRFGHSSQGVPDYTAIRAYRRPSRAVNDPHRRLKSCKSRRLCRPSGCIAPRRSGVRVPLAPSREKPCTRGASVVAPAALARPGAWHRGTGLDASLIVARLGVAARRSGPALRCPEPKGAARAVDHHPRAARRDLRDRDSPPDGDRRCLVVREASGFAEAKNDEELAERDVAASETLGAILGQLARQSGGEEVAR
jgi:hypothetical protein